MAEAARRSTAPSFWARPCATTLARRHASRTAHTLACPGVRQAPACHPARQGCARASEFSSCSPICVALTPPPPPSLSQSATAAAPSSPPHFRVMYRHASLTPAQEPGRHALVRRHLLTVDEEGGDARRRRTARRSLLGNPDTAPTLGSLGAHVGVDYVQVADEETAAWVVGVLRGHPGKKRRGEEFGGARHSRAPALAHFSLSLSPLQTSPGPSWTRPSRPPPIPTPTPPPSPPPPRPTTLTSRPSPP